MEGLNTWGWLIIDGERNYIFDFNFNDEKLTIDGANQDGRIGLYTYI